MRRLLLGLLALAAAGLVFVLYRGFGRDPHEVPFMLRGKPAPPFALKRLDSGQPVTLEQLKGKPVVLTFWASWCEPCKTEEPVIEWGARSLSDRAQFFGVVFEDTLENAQEFLRGKDLSSQLWDEKSQTAVDYGVSGVPETYFIDADGIIRFKTAGPILDQRELVAGVEAMYHPIASSRGNR